jgi:hypothetical protein
MLLIIIIFFLFYFIFSLQESQRRADRCPRRRRKNNRGVPELVRCGRQIVYEQRATHVKEDGARENSNGAMVR